MLRNVIVTIPGTKTKVSTTVITARLWASDGSGGVQTAHLVAASSTWEWMTVNIVAYRAGRCH